MFWNSNNGTPTLTDAEQYRNYLIGKIATARRNGHSKMQVTMRELSDNTVGKPRNVPNMLQVIKGDLLKHESGHQGVSKPRFSSETSIRTVWTFKL